MARYSGDHKERTREAIIEAAADRISGGGLEALAIASIMGEVGLTHGGFYAHFRSRDALLAAAVTRLFDRALAILDRLEQRHGHRALARYADFYLSARHRDDPAHGCPVPALSADIGRAGPEVRAAFDDGLARIGEAIGRLMPPEPGRGGPARQGLALIGEMAGLVSLARAMGDARRSAELLAAKRRSLSF